MQSSVVVYGILKLDVTPAAGGLSMAVTMKDLGIDRLSTEDRVALVEEIWDSLAADAEDAPITEAQRLELERRLIAHDVSPEDVVRWEEVKARALSRAGR